MVGSTGPETASIWEGFWRLYELTEAGSLFWRIGDMNGCLSEG